MPFKFLASAIALMFGCSAVAEEALFDTFENGVISVTVAVAGETTANAKAAAGYFIVTNQGPTEDRLISVTADFPKVMIHATENKDGVMAMKMVDGVTIQPGSSAVLRPGATHVMFLGLSEGLSEGDQIDATLTFETSGDLPISFVVRPIGEIEDLINEAADQ